MASITIREYVSIVFKPCSLWYIVSAILGNKDSVKSRRKPPKGVTAMTPDALGVLSKYV